MEPLESRPLQTDSPAVSTSTRSVLLDDLWPSDGRPLSTSPLSPLLHVTSTPVGLNLLNKASSNKTPSCLSAWLHYKSFIKQRGRSRSISHHPHREQTCVCVCEFVLSASSSSDSADVSLMLLNKAQQGHYSLHFINLNLFCTNLQAFHPSNLHA